MKAILTDVTKCVGCEKCVEACAVENNLPPNFLWRWTCKDGLSGDRFTSIVRVDTEAYVRKQCRHCISPACVTACPVGALTKTEHGAVIYNADKCMGCRYCMMACPYGIPRFTWQYNVPLIRKCTMCYETRLKNGMQPACTEACPEEATIFGERDELITEAKRRLAAEPDKYIQKVYGEYEVGGTSVLYISNVPLDILTGKREPGTKSIPKIIAPAMDAVLPVFFAVGIGMGLTYWITKRRSEVAKVEQEKRTDITPGDRSAGDEIENS